MVSPITRTIIWLLISLQLACMYVRHTTHNDNVSLWKYRNIICAREKRAAAILEGLDRRMDNNIGIISLTIDTFIPLCIVYGLCILRHNYARSSSSHADPGLKMAFKCLNQGIFNSVPLPWLWHWRH